MDAPGDVSNIPGLRIIVGSLALSQDHHAPRMCLLSIIPPANATKDEAHNSDFEADEKWGGGTDGQALPQRWQVHSLCEDLMY